MPKINRLMFTLAATGAVLAAGLLVGCGQASESETIAPIVTAKDVSGSPTDVASPVPAPEPTQADIEAEKATVKREALLNPEWISVTNLPKEWSGLYQKNCKIGGPEDSHFFEYRDHRINTQYSFVYISFPSSLNKAPKANVYPIPYKVWQNSKWPDHYLLYGLESFSQKLLEDGWVRGMHQTLDGEAWDIAQHMQTKYRETDVVRWAADVDNREDYGSRPPCNPKLAQPWSGQIFKTQSGKGLTLQAVIEGL